MNASSVIGDKLNHAFQLIRSNRNHDAILFINQLMGEAEAANDSSIKFLRLLHTLGRVHGNFFTKEGDEKAMHYLERSNLELHAKVLKWKRPATINASGKEKRREALSFLIEIKSDLVLLYCNRDMLSRAEVLLQDLKEIHQIQVGFANKAY